MENDLKLELLENTQVLISGLYAWLVMFTSILAYDTYAITSKKRKKNQVETMSGALWKLLSNRKTVGPALMVWFGLTYHLFADRNARKSYSLLRSK